MFKGLPCIEGHKDGKDGKGFILVVWGQNFFLFRIKRLNKGYDNVAERRPCKYIHTHTLLLRRVGENGTCSSLPAGLRQILRCSILPAAAVELINRQWPRVAAYVNGCYTRLT